MHVLVLEVKALHETLGQANFQLLLHTLCISTLCISRSPHSSGSSS